MHQESAGKIHAKSPVGARGLFQIMPATARDLRLSDPHDPEPAAQAAAHYLSILYKRYDGDLNLSLAAYNWGMGNVDRYKRQGYRSFDNMPQETRNYIKQVTRLRAYYN